MPVAEGPTEQFGDYAEKRWTLEGVLSMKDGSMQTKVRGPGIVFGDEVEVVPASEVERLTEALVTQRLAAAILLGAVAADHPERLDDAERVVGNVQGHLPHVEAATRQLIADTRRYDEGTAGELEGEIRAALHPDEEPA